MDSLSQPLAYQETPSPAPLINVDYLRELLLRLKYMNLRAALPENAPNIQNDVMLACPCTTNCNQIEPFQDYAQPSTIDSEVLNTVHCISRKVFVGGLPQDISKSSLLRKFTAYGRVRLDFPSEPTHPPRTRKVDKKLSTSGYVFLIYDTEEAVLNLLNDCLFYEGNYFLPFREESLSTKFAQVRPWQLSSIAYIPNIDAIIDPRLTVFIGGVPRPLTSGELAVLLERNYGPLLYCEIDVDPDLFYPKGAARAVFASYSSYVKAIHGRFLHIPNVDCNKRTVEIKPYKTDDALCDECLEEASFHFCNSCLQYYCERCYDRMNHANDSISDTTQQTSISKSSFGADYSLPNSLMEQLAECTRSGLLNSSSKTSLC